MVATDRPGENMRPKSQNQMSRRDPRSWTTNTCAMAEPSTRVENSKRLVRVVPVTAPGARTGVANRNAPIADDTTAHRRAPRVARIVAARSRFAALTRNICAVARRARSARTRPDRRPAVRGATGLQQSRRSAESKDANAYRPSRRDLAANQIQRQAAARTRGRCRASRVPGHASVGRMPHGPRRRTAGAFAADDS